MLAGLLLLVAAAPAQEPPAGGYLVVLERALAGGGYERAAERLARHHAAPIWHWDGDWDALEAELLRRRPCDLALVLAPSSIDANLPRRLVPILTRFDDDPFVDCAFGVITGATGDDAAGFVANILRAARRPLPSRKLEVVSVQVDRCQLLGPQAGRGGPARALETTSLWLSGRDPAWPDFLATHRGMAAAGGLIEWGHCGDSQGIWLFSMERNRERAKHWPFDPARVGWDPDGEMPRLTPAGLLEGVRLGPALIVNGSCHSAVTHATIVGGDIVSTFGDTGGVVRFHPIAAAESFPLQAIAHGAAAYLGPLAANNANRAAIEEWWIRRGGLPLGEVVKRSHDELVLGAREARLAFACFEDGRPAPPEAPMFHDTVHRVLFGDPAWTPWPDEVPTSHRLELAELPGGVLEVRIRWERLGEDPFVWDPWLEQRHPAGERGRIHVRVPWESASARAPVAEVAEAWAERDGVRTPLALEPRVLFELDRDGRGVLHLKLAGARAAMDARGVAGGAAPEALSAVVRLRREPGKAGVRREVGDNERSVRLLSSPER